MTWRRRMKHFACPGLIIAVVIWSFLPTSENGFVFDDENNFINNLHYRGLSLSHLAWMFGTLHKGPYQPLSWLSHGLVYSVWGLSPRAYHGVNLLLHAANAVLAYFLILALLRRRAGDADPLAACGSAVVGALFFAIHPLRVEVVAWATERRELLGAFFLLVTLLTYVRMTEEHREGGHRWRRWYVLSLTSFVLSLLSKAQGITLPAILLVLDVYPLGRFARDSGRSSAGSHSQVSVLIEKIPYGALAVGAAEVALLGQMQEVAAAPLAYHGLLQRVMQAGYGLCFYLSKTVFPFGLSPLYLLHMPLDPANVKYVLCLFVVVGVTVALVVFRRRCPWALAAWVCYVVSVSPFLGFVQMGPQIAADRYTYVPCLPWAVLVAAGVERLWCAWKRRGRPRLVGTVGLALVGMVLILFGVRTRAQTQIWKDDLTLWSRALEIEPDNYFAYHNRGYERLSRGDLQGAISDFDQVCSPTTPYATAYKGRAEARRQAGDLDGALADYAMFLQLTRSRE